MTPHADVVLSSLHPSSVNAKHREQRACVYLVSNQEEEVMPRCQGLDIRLTYHYRTNTPYSNVINCSMAQVSTFWSKRRKTQHLISSNSLILLFSQHTPALVSFSTQKQPALVTTHSAAPRETPQEQHFRILPSAPTLGLSSQATHQGHVPKRGPERSARLPSARSDGPAPRCQASKGAGHVPRAWRGGPGGGRRGRGRGGGEVEPGCGRGDLRFPPPSAAHLAGPPLARGPVPRGARASPPALPAAPPPGRAFAASRLRPQPPPPPPPPPWPPLSPAALWEADLTRCCRRPAGSAARRHGGRDRR